MFTFLFPHELYEEFAAVAASELVNADNPEVEIVAVSLIPENENSIFKFPDFDMLPINSAEVSISMQSFPPCK